MIDNCWTEVKYTLCRFGLGSEKGLRSMAAESKAKDTPKRLACQIDWTAESG